MVYLLIALYLIYGAFLNRLRGGASSTLLNINIGTQTTRLLTSQLFVLPLLAALYFNKLSMPFSLYNALPIELTVVTLTLGYILAGWAPFQSMDTSPVTEKSYLESLPNLLFTPDTTPWKFLGMMEAGFICLLPTAISYALFYHHYIIMAYALLGLLFAPAYLLARLFSFPINKLTPQKMAWGEVFSGVVIAVFFLFSVGVVKL
jgi:hypothetical protein